MKASILKKFALASALCAGAFGISTTQAASVAFTSFYTQTSLFRAVRRGLLCLTVIGAALFALTTSGWGQTVSFTGTYTQNFDSMGTSGTTPPTGWSMFMGEGGNNATWSSSITANGFTLSVASMVVTTGALTVNNAPTATQINGYNAQGSSSSDRVIATSPTGVTGNAIQLRLVNNTGAALSGVKVGYDIRRYTVATTANELPGYQLFYSTDSGTTWVNVSALNPALTGATVNVPNTVGVTTVPLTTVTLSSSVATGSELRLRWVDDNAQQTSPDQIIGLDNVTITAVTSAGPVVGITSPANSASFIPGSSIVVTASASESGGTVTNVAFYSGSSLLGNVASAPYNYSWSSVPAGSYALTAVAADSGGILATSAVVNITVAHLAPMVAITTPTSGAAYTAPASISLTATASDTDGNVTNMAFYQGSTLLANVASAPYSYTWTSVVAGSYSLTAVASVDTGASATSTAVSVTVTNLPNPLVASFTGSYSENFDLDLTNSTTTMPTGFQAMYLPGDHFLYTNGTPITSNAIATASIGSGAATLVAWNVGSAVTKASYQLFNIGCWDSLNDRALGTDPTGTAGTVIQLALTNNTGGALNGVTFSYTEKCLTNGSTSNGSYTDDGTERLELPGYSFFYSLTGDTNATNWFGVSALCLTNWVQGTSSDSGPVTITFPTPLPANGVMYFRWADDNCVASSPDQMYAIDNIGITAYNPIGPVVSFTSPTNNQNYIPGTAITLSATATDLGTNITSVAFYVGSTALPFSVTANGSSYSATIPGVYVGNPGAIPIGSYSLNAVATDAAGLSATSAVVSITVGYVPPTVSLTSPATGSSYPAPASIPLSASAASADGMVTNVAFYQGTTLLANVTSAPFNYTWANVFAGSYNLTALATDSQGLTATSSVVSVTVTNGYGVPLVSITSPANNVNYLPNSSIAITANASESGGTLTNVEFYANAIDLGGATSAPYSLTWPSVPAGVYALTAVADDSAGNSTTSAVVNITVSVPNVPPTVSLTNPTNHAAFNAPATISLSATASDSDGTVTNVAFYQGATLLANVTTAPYLFTWTNVSSGVYALSAVATDNSGASTTSSVANVTVANLAALQTLQQIKTVFVIALENHDWVQQNPQGSPQQVFGNPAAPYVNSLTTPGNSNAVQVSYATHYFNVASGEHPSEPNYIWAEAGTEFGTHTDNDPSTGSGNLFTCQHLSGQLTAAGIPWRSYQEDVEYSSSSTVSASGGSGWVNPYNGTTQYSYAVKHNPMAFFTDTQNKNCYPLTNLWTDLTNNNVGRYNWITPDQYNEMHSSLPSGYTYHGVAYTGDQAAIAEGDNALSIIIPKIMASAAYQDHGVIIIWTDETESTDDTNTTLPYIIISPLAKGNAYASTLPYSHSSDLKTMDELFGLAYQTNAIPAASIDAQNTGYNYVDGHSAVINDLSDFFQPANLPAPALTVQQNGTTLTNGANALAFGAVNLGANASSTFTATNTGSASLVLSNIVVTGVNAGDFTVSSITLPATVLAGGSATFNVVFTPSVGGLEDAALQITDNDTNNDPFTLNLAGTGVLVPPTVSLTSPANGASFSAPASLTLTATASDTDGTVTNVAFYKGTTLLGNATSAPFTFTTASFYGGSYALTAVATDNNGLSSTSSVVNVTVTAPILTVQQSGSPLANGGSATSFGAVNLGANVSSTFTVTNTGNGTLTLTNIVATGANAGDFTVTGITLPATVYAGQSTTFNVVFAPLGAGARAATLQISDNDANNNPFTLALTGTGVLVPPTVSLTAPASGASFAAPAMLALAATAADIDGTVTNVAFYQGTTLLGNATGTPFTFTTANIFAGSYGLTAVATDNNGLSSTSSVVNVTVTNTATLAVLQSIKTVFIIAMENHDLVQKNPTGNPQQILGNPAAPYFNSLITPGNSNAVQTAWATHMFSCAINGEHPSEPNYIWQEAGTDFGIRTDNDPNSPATSHNVFTNVMHLSGQLTAAGIPWRSYQEDLEYTTSEEVSASGSGKPANPYNGTTQYNYGVKHNPMAFFADTQNKNCYPMTNFWTDLTNNNIGRYNWITPDQNNEWHSALSGGYTYQGVHYTSDQAAIASGDNALSIIIPKIMASAAYQDHGVIIIWTDETESTDDTNTTLPYVIISPLAKGNAYASTLPYSHASDMKTMDEIFGLAYQTNAIPAAELTAQNVGYNYIDGHSAPVNDLSDFFQGVGTDAPTLVVQQGGSPLANGGIATAFGAVNIGANVSSTFTVTNTGNGTLILTNIVATGANAGDFTVSGLTLPATVYAGQSATFNVVFSPLGAGARAATLQITDNDVNNNPFTLTLTGTGVLVPPTVSLTSPANRASFSAPASLTLTATAADIDGTVTNMAFYQGTTLLGNAKSAPFTFTTANLFAGSYTLTAVATDNNGLTSTSSVVNVTITNTPALNVLQSIKTVFIIAMENHDLVQKNPTGSPQQILGNPAAPYFNSLITPGNPNAAQTAWATHMFSCAINGEHPSEPNYIWQEAGTDFGIRTDNDPNSPATSHNVFTNVMHLSGELTAAGIPWRSYQEDLEFTTSSLVSKSGTTTVVNPYNGTKQYNYGVKHNPMAFFPDTQNKYCYPMTNFWTDLTNNNIGRYNWITPDQYNEWHSALSGTYTYNGTAWTGDQSAIASGDNCLSIIIPKIMASQAYKDHGVIIIWTDETESTDDTNTTLPYVIISPLCKGNAYASTLPYSHASDLKTMDEIFGLAYQTNAIPAAYYDAQNDGKYDYVDGHSATVFDLSDFFQGVPSVPPVANTLYVTRPANVSLKIAISDLLTNVTDAYGYTVSLVGVGTDGLNLTSTNGTTLATNSTYIFYTNSVTPNVNDSFNYTVSDGHGGTAIGTVVIVMNNNLNGQTGAKLNVSSTSVTANFFGYPGIRYSVDRSTNLTVGAGWVSISTNTAPTNGLIQVQDGFLDLGIPVPPGPAAAYYRLRYNP